MEKLLKPLRDRIDEIDTQILDLLNRRARVAQEVGHVKNKLDAPIFRPDREAQVQMIANDIKSGNVKPLQIFLQTSIDEGIDDLQGNHVGMPFT